jgi:hypothetical protein
MKCGILIVVLFITALSTLRGEELTPAPDGARFTYHQKYEAQKDGTSIVWLEFLLPDGRVVWIPRYRVRSSGPVQPPVTQS